MCTSIVGLCNSNIMVVEDYLSSWIDLVIVKTISFYKF